MKRALVPRTWLQERLKRIEKRKKEKRKKAKQASEEERLGTRIEREWEMVRESGRRRRTPEELRKKAEKAMAEEKQLRKNARAGAREAEKAALRVEQAKVEQVASQVKKNEEKARKKAEKASETTEERRLRKEAEKTKRYKRKRRERWRDIRKRKRKKMEPRETAFLAQPGGTPLQVKRLRMLQEDVDDADEDYEFFEYPRGLTDEQSDLFMQPRRDAAMYIGKLRGELHWRECEMERHHVRSRKRTILLTERRLTLLKAWVEKREDGWDIRAFVHWADRHQESWQRFLFALIWSENSAEETIAYLEGQLALLRDDDDESGDYDPELLWDNYYGRGGQRARRERAEARYNAIPPQETVKLIGDLHDIPPQVKNVKLFGDRVKVKVALLKKHFIASCMSDSAGSLESTDYDELERREGACADTLYDEDYERESWYVRGHRGRQRGPRNATLEEKRRRMIRIARGTSEGARYYREIAGDRTRENIDREKEQIDREREKRDEEQIDREREERAEWDDIEREEEQSARERAEEQDEGVRVEEQIDREREERAEEQIDREIERYDIDREIEGVRVEEQDEWVRVEEQDEWVRVEEQIDREREERAEEQIDRQIERHDMMEEREAVQELARARRECVFSKRKLVKSAQLLSMTRQAIVVDKEYSELLRVEKGRLTKKLERIRARREKAERDEEISETSDDTAVKQRFLQNTSAKTAQLLSMDRQAIVVGDEYAELVCAGARCT